MILIPWRVDEYWKSRGTVSLTSLTRIPKNLGHWKITLKKQRFAVYFLIANKANPFNLPHAAIIGSPPMFHGSIQPGKNAEVLLSRTFPNIAMFVEKPISASPVQDVMECSKYLKERQHIVSVGYMLRYLKCVQKMFHFYLLN